jgi:hypothetical protein
MGNKKKQMQFYNGGSHHTRHSDTTIVPTHIHQIHQSLIHHNIITHPRVINCSSFYWKQEKDLPFPDRHKLINRCGNVHLCPICSYLQDRKIFARVKPMSNLLQQHDGDVHLITFTLRHNRSHTLQQLSEVLNKSVKEIKTSYPFKKFYGSKDRLFSLSKYEVSWSEDYGYHPHCHIQIGTTNPTPMKLIESELKSKWIEIVTKHAPDRTMIPSEEFCCHLVSNPSIEHSLDKIDDFFRGKKSINKEGLQKIITDDIQSTVDEPPLVVEPTLFQRILAVLKTIYNNLLNRYRMRLDVNKKHVLYQPIKCISFSKVSEFGRIVELDQSDIL